MFGRSILISHWHEGLNSGWSVAHELPLGPCFSGYFVLMPARMQVWVQSGIVLGNTGEGKWCICLLAGKTVQRGAMLWRSGAGEKIHMQCLSAL